MYALFNRNPRVLDEAIAILRKAIELDSSSAITHFIFGETLKAQGKLDEAITAYRKAVQLDPNDALYHIPHKNLEAALKEQEQQKKFFGLF